MPTHRKLIFLENIAKDPNNPKFKEINLSNGAFNRRVGNIIGGKNILQLAGFEDELGFLKMKKIDLEHLSKIHKHLDTIIEKKLTR